MGAGKSGKHTGKAVINVESRLELSVGRGSLVRGSYAAHGRARKNLGGGATNSRVSVPAA